MLVNQESPRVHAGSVNLLRLSVRRRLGKVPKRVDRVNYKKLVSQPCGNLPTASPAMPATGGILLIRSFSKPGPSRTRTVLVLPKPTAAAGGSHLPTS